MAQQLSLIEEVAIARRRGRTLADIGMSRAAQAAETVSAGWCDAASEAVRKFAAHQGGVFIMEMARMVVQNDLPPMARLRAWGVVTRICIKRGYIEPVRGQFFPAASSNGSPKQVYRRGPKA